MRCKKLKEKLNYEKNMKEFYKEQRDIYKNWYESYKDLVEYWANELKFEKLQKQHYLQVLDEIEMLVDMDTDKDIILKIIANWQEKGKLDLMVHNNSISKVKS